MVGQGAQLEPDLGSLKFLGLVGELLLLSHIATVGLAAAAAKALPDLLGSQYYGSCAIGFSAVLFAMKVVLSHRTPGWSFVGGIALPTKVQSSSIGGADKQWALTQTDPCNWPSKKSSHASHPADRERNEDSYHLNVCIVEHSPVLSKAASLVQVGTAQQCT